MKVRICKNCGEQNAAEAWSCARCGSTLGIDTVQQVNTETENAFRKICLLCGEEVHPLQHTCPSCGGTSFAQEVSADDTDSYLDAIKKQEEAAEYVTRGALLLKQGRFKEAEQVLKKAIECNPYNATAHGNMGAVFLEQNRPAEAIPWLEKALELNPNLQGVPAALRRARALVEKKVVADSLPGKSRPLSPMPLPQTREDLLWLRRDELRALKSRENTDSITEDDIAWAEKILDITERAAMAATRRNYSRALHLYDQALDLAPKHPMLLLSIGACHVNKGNFDKGVAFIKQASVYKPHHPIIQENLKAAMELLAESAPLSFLEVLFSFSGRIGRKTYWIKGVLPIWLFLEAVVLIAPSIQAGDRLLVIASLLVIWSSLALQVKRLHDRGKTGWWVLVYLIPYLGWLWALIELGMLAGTPDRNAYGPLPDTRAST